MRFENPIPRLNATWACGISVEAVIATKEKARIAQAVRFVC